MTWEFFISEEHLRDLGITLGIILLFLLFRKIFAKYIYSLILKVSKKAPNEFFSFVFEAFKKPLQWVFIIIGIYVAIRYYPYFDHNDKTLLRFIKVAFIFLASWGLFNLSSASSILFKKINEKTNIHIDEILIPFLSRAVQFIIVALSFSVILEALGYRISGFIAGLGLGGLAFSLAAKDMLANLFGGFVIITEKPFTIGDWVMTPSVEGTVEDISFRSTRIRTFSQALVTVPNATLANESITNWSKMGKRQITFTITIAYDHSAQKIKQVVNKIEHLLKNNPDIHPETIFATANEYKENGINLFFYFFTKTTDWGEYLKIREEVNLQILDVLNEEDIIIAIPSRRLYTTVNEQHDDEKRSREQQL